MSQKSQQISTIVSALLGWFSSSARDLPWRRTCNPYAIWISEIMLQQTQVKTVIPYWERWMRALPDVHALAAADIETVLKLWEGLGYYSRARNAQRAAKMILEKCGGQFPSTLEGLLELPGIGRYTAGAICSIAFNRPVPVLDGNVARVLSRIYGIAGDIKSKAVNVRFWCEAGHLVQRAAEMPDRRLAGMSDCMLQIAENSKFNGAQLAARTGNGFAGNCSLLNQSLMELGALVCTPKLPACDVCPLQQLCCAKQSNRVGEFPNPISRPEVTRRRFVAFVVTKRGKYLVQKRPDHVVNGSFWEFPNIEIIPGKSREPEQFAEPFIATTKKPVFRVTHTITRYRIRLEVFSADLKPGAKVAGEWVTREQLQALPFTSAHRKVIDGLISGNA